MRSEADRRFKNFYEALFMVSMYIMKSPVIIRTQENILGFKKRLYRIL